MNDNNQYIGIKLGGGTVSNRVLDDIHNAILHEWDLHLHKGRVPSLRAFGKSIGEPANWLSRVLLKLPRLAVEMGFALAGPSQQLTYIKMPNDNA